MQEEKQRDKQRSKKIVKTREIPMIDGP